MSQQYFYQYPPDLSGSTCDRSKILLDDTWKYYKNVRNRDSWNNAGGDLVSIVNAYPPQAYNAGWSTTWHQISFSMGDGLTTNDWSSDPDVTTHEVSHGVTETTSNLTYAFECGALNEAFSDIMAAAQDAYKNGLTPATWKMGEHVKKDGTPLRYMNDPAADNRSLDYYPDWALVEPTLTIDDDRGWVHLTSGISNLAFYLMSQGGTHPRGKTNVNVPSTLGITNAASIFYRAFTTYMGPTSQMIDARAATVQAAADLGLSTTIVNLAWDAVGVAAVGDNNYPINVSTRANVGTGDNILIAGFVLGGGGSAKPMLLRGIGPGLVNQGVPGTMTDPVLAFYSGTTLIATNDDWSSSSDKAAIQQAAAAVGAFALADPSKDASLLRTLGSGVYSIQVYGNQGGTGEALAEVYDTNATNSNHLLNISSRCRVTPTHPMIAGFVINGTAYKRLLIRAVGPGLSQLGVQGVISNPKITIMSGSTAIYQNDNWVFDDPAIAAATSKVGASPALSPGSADAVLLVSLHPGIYTAIADSSDGSSGICLVEVYEIGDGMP